MFRKFGYISYQNRYKDSYTKLAVFLVNIDITESKDAIPFVSGKVQYPKQVKIDRDHMIIATVSYLISFVFGLMAASISQVPENLISVSGVLSFMILAIIFIVFGALHVKEGLKIV